MDQLRVLLVPFHATSLMLVAIFSVLITIFGYAGFYGLIGQLILNIWVFKYCYALIEHLADGDLEPPVMSTDMLSPFEIRPWVQLGIVIAGFMLCQALGVPAGIFVGVVLLALLPASIAVLGIGEPFYQTANPLLLWRLIRGLGPYYLALLAAIPVYVGLPYLAWRLGAWSLAQNALILLCEISFFALIGGSLYLRRHQLGFEPRRSPERTAAREEAERVKLRARMIDDVFQQVRIGKHIEATRPLAKWLSGLDGATAALDAQYLIGQALGWDSVAGLNTLASTVIRHLLRAGRPDAALAIFEKLRQRSPALTLDSADDLRMLAEFAENAGRHELAASMRLETPIHRP